MKELLFKSLKIVLIVGLLLLVITIVLALVRGFGLPIWVGIFILLLIVICVIGFILLKRIFQKKREQRFVQQVISEEASRAASLSDKDKERSQELQSRWKEAMDTLRSSHLRKRGNPLYVLPWYLLIGESGSGKTTAIKSARLSSPFAEVSKTSGISGTRNCDWWFFEQAIIIDTAGRYAIPVDEGRDKDEWQRFLVQLARFRKREPLNGLVITVAANKLMAANPELLEEDGNSLRLRIDELMRVLGAKFPVYLLVTKCDLVQGMTNFCGVLPEKALDQAMGMINHDMTPDIATFHGRAMHNLVERLKDLRLQLLNEPSVKKGDPSLFLFPEEFERLKSGLFAFIKGAFQENPYQETPILRGMFFSSGRQEGSPYSHFMKSLGLIGDHDVLPGTSKGMFLFDFFSKILPRDRGMFAPTLQALYWNRLTRSLGLSIWVLFTIIVGILLGHSLYKNARIISEITKQFNSLPVLKGEMISDVHEMDRFRKTIFDAEKRDNDWWWWTPRFGLNRSRVLVSHLKEEYDNQFQKLLLSDLDKAMQDRILGFTQGTPDNTIGNYFSHLVRRINLLKGRLNEDDFESLQNRPQPGYDMFIPDSFSDLRERFHDLYLYDLKWRQDRNEMNKEIQTLQTYLKHLLDIKDNDLTFMVAWVNANPDVTGISLDDFWNITNSQEEEPSIPPAYTLEGKNRIDLLISEAEAALIDPLYLADGKQKFIKWYTSSCLEAWQTFSGYFPKGRLRLTGKEEFQNTVDQIAAGQGPYHQYLERFTEELAPYQTETDRDWVLPAFRYVLARQEAVKAAAASKSGAVVKTIDKQLQRLKSKTGIRANTGDISSKLLTDQFKAGIAFSNYENALLEISKSITNRKSAFNAASETFIKAENPNLSSEEKPPFLASNEALQELKSALITGKKEEDILWNIIAGPQNFLWEYACNETACYLNNQWENKVLLETDGMRNREAINKLVLGDSGLAKKVIEGDAAPFIERSLRRGYYAKSVLGNKIPFEDSFFTYLSRGEQAARPTSGTSALASNYTITITGKPTDVNREASKKAKLTRLEVECGDSILELVNMNFPVKKTFDWSYDTCKDTVFSIEIGTLVLPVVYKGSLGFADFLQDFGQGEKRFTPSDFPKYRRDLENMGITYIQVNYTFDGHRALIDALNKRAAIPSVPRKMAQCWD